jgi:hypothetical protein
MNPKLQPVCSSAFSVFMKGWRKIVAIYANVVRLKAAIPCLNIPYATGVEHLMRLRPFQRWMDSQVLNERNKNAVFCWNNPVHRFGFIAIRVGAKSHSL